MSFYEKMGLKPLINASETYTNLGGSLMAEETLDAMRQAGHSFVDMGKLMDAVCARAATLTRNEAVARLTEVLAEHQLRLVAQTNGVLRLERQD